MHEITPSLIAEIASRLYNELPGANVPPKTEMDASNFPQAHVPSGGAPPLPTNPSQVGTASTAASQSHVPTVHTQPSTPSSGPSHSMGRLANSGAPQHSPTEMSPSSHSGPTMYTPPLRR